jgi:hypothetical protein
MDHRDVSAGIWQEVLKRILKFDFTDLFDKQGSGFHLGKTGEQILGYIF